MAGIIGMSFKSFEARAEEKRSGGNVDINSVPTIENVSIKEADIGGIKEIVSIEFRFETSYKPKIGSMEITGEVLYNADDPKKVVSDWEEKKLDDKLGVDVINLILKKCISKAVVMADDLRLPPPVTFPVVKAKSKAKDSDQ